MTPLETLQALKIQYDVINTEIDYADRNFHKLQNKEAKESCLEYLEKLKDIKSNLLAKILALNIPVDHFALFERSKSISQSFKINDQTNTPEQIIPTSKFMSEAIIKQNYGL